MSLALRASTALSSRLPAILRTLMVGASLAGTVALGSVAAQANEPAPKTEAAPKKEAEKVADKKAAPEAKAPAAGESKKTAEAKPPVAKEDAKPLPADIAGECAWTGQRVVSLLSRDDVEQARRFMEFYRLFGCKESHVAPVFRCVIREQDASSTEALGDRVQRCWASPEEPKEKEKEKEKEADKGKEKSR